MCSLTTYLPLSRILTTNGPQCYSTLSSGFSTGDGPHCTEPCFTRVELSPVRFFFSISCGLVLLTFVISLHNKRIRCTTLLRSAIWVSPRLIFSQLWLCFKKKNWYLMKKVVDLFNRNTWGVSNEHGWIKMSWKKNQISFYVQKSLFLLVMFYLVPRAICLR